jgi:hypothetical protein
MRTRAVVHAQLVDHIGAALTRHEIVHGNSWPQRIERRSHAFMLPPAAWRRTQNASTLNIGHDQTQTVGRLVALERTPDDGGGIWGTWVSTLDLSPLEEHEWWVSAEVRWAGGDVDADDVTLTGAALVPRSGAVCTQPALLLAGNLADGYDRSHWRLKQPLRDRLERAAAALRRNSDTITLHDELEARAVRRRLTEENRYSPPPKPDAGPTPPQWETTWAPGQLEWAASRGRVISVR